MKLLIIFLSLMLLSKDVNKWYCDIKGNVKNPGVYEINKNTTINDVIKMAGGLNKTAYTDNINLSKKVTDEMVIYINSKGEIDKIKSLNSCNCTPIYTYKECVEKEVINATEKINYEIIESIPIENNKDNDVNEDTINVVTEYQEEEVTTKIEEAIEEKPTTAIIELETESLININTCELEELKTLKGLGEKKALKIIEYRDNNGLFKSIEEIKNVSGIGEATFNAIKDFIKV